MPSCNSSSDLIRSCISIFAMTLALSAASVGAEPTMFNAQLFINDSEAYSTCVTGAPNVPGVGQCVITGDVCGAAVAVRLSAQPRYDEMAKIAARAASCAANVRALTDFVAACERNRCTSVNRLTGVRSR